MEINPSSIEKSDQQIVWSSDHEQAGLGHVRTYTCNFCKRGFSNAQALGGHMNVHRKDRAKLKEASSDETLLPVDMEKNDPSDHHPDQVSQDHDNSLQLKSSEEKIWSPNRPSIFSGKDDAFSSSSKDGIGELVQLPLFGEMPSTRHDLEASSHVEKSVESSSSQMELDLELRLGIEPHGR